MNWFKFKKTTCKDTDYFKKAKLWADDMFGAMEQSRNRYQIAFLSAMVLNALAITTITILAKKQTLVPMMVHHYQNGITTVAPINDHTAPINKAQVESDIIRYITNRESYDSSSYRSQFDLVTLLSNNLVAAEYTREQERTAKEAPVNILGATGHREVHVYSINFLDTLTFNEKDLLKDHHNLAEVVFTLTDIDKSTGNQTERHYNALIAWQYTTPSSIPDVRWKNWDGFLVTRYSKQIRNV